MNNHLLNLNKRAYARLFISNYTHLGHLHLPIIDLRVTGDALMPAQPVAAGHALTLTARAAGYELKFPAGACLIQELANLFCRENASFNKCRLFKLLFHSINDRFF